LLEEIERFVADKIAGIDTAPKEIIALPAPESAASLPILK